jgi:phage shock protein A
MSDTDDFMELIGAFGVFALIITLVALVIVQGGKTIRARAAMAREDEYRKLAERSITAQESIERRLAVLEGQLGQTQTRIASIERTLQQVE